MLKLDTVKEFDAGGKDKITISELGNIEDDQLQSQARCSISNGRSGDPGRPQAIVPTPKPLCSDSETFIPENDRTLQTTKFPDTIQSDSRSRTSYVRLWTPKNNASETPKRTRIQLGSLRSVKAEKTGEMKHTREDYQGEGGRGAEDGTKFSDKESRNHKASAEVDDTEGKLWNIAHPDREAVAQAIDRKYLQNVGVKPIIMERGPNQEVEKRNIATEKDDSEIDEQHWADVEEAFSDELTNHAERMKQKVEWEMKATDEARAQAEAKAKGRAEREIRVAQAVKARAQAIHEKKAKVRAEAEARAEQKRVLLYSSYDKIRRKEEMDRQQAIRCRPLSFTDTLKARVKEEEDLAVEKRLQRRALFHFEALRKIEERYNQRSWRNTRHVQALPRESYRDGYANCINERSRLGFYEEERTQIPRIQKKGKGGLNALLAPVNEENFLYEDDSSPRSSIADNHVLMFQRIKKAQKRAAAEQRAAMEAKAKQRRAQLKAAVEKVEKMRALARQGDKQAEGKECSRARCHESYAKASSSRDNSTSKRAVSSSHVNPSPYDAFNPLDPSAKRIKEMNERARSKAQEEQEREKRKRAKAKTEERWARRRKSQFDQESAEMNDRLDGSERKQEFDPPLRTSNNRFNSTLDSSRNWKSAPNSRLATPVNSSRRQTQNPRFMSPLDRSTTPNKNYRFKSPNDIVKTPTQNFATGIANSPLGILAFDRKIPIQRPGTRKEEINKHIANWERELRTAQMSKARSQERSTGRRVTIQDDPLPHRWRKENYDRDISSEKKTDVTNNLLRSSGFGKGLNKPPKGSESPLTVPSSKPKPDHYTLVEEDCSTEFSYPKKHVQNWTSDQYNPVEDDCPCSFLSNRKELLSKGRFSDVHEKENPQTGYDCKRKKTPKEGLSWLGKMYNVITPKGHHKQVSRVK